MNTHLHPCLVLTLAVLPWAAVSQVPAPIQFQISPVQVATGSNAVFTLQTISNTFSITWVAPGGGTLGQWVGGQAVLNSVPQYQGRVTITATQLTINSCQLSDAGNYTVTVVPTGTSGFSTSSLSAVLRVFVAVSPVNLLVPSVTIEGGNVTLTCSWSSGTDTTVAWGRGGSSLASNSHITINGGSLIINPVGRSDAGQYSCTVSNPISAQTATASLTVYYGPDTPQVNKSSSQCVGGGDATVGETVQLTCTSVSLPPAVLSWEYNGNVLTGSQTNSGTLNLQIFTTNQSGKYTCKAQNSITLGTSQQQISLSIVEICLSGGAVAGIVVACFVVLVLIIVAIVLLLRQRNVDQRLRNLAGPQKSNPNNEVPPAPQNGHVTTGGFNNGVQRNPSLHNINRLNLNQDTVWHTGQENNETRTQNRLNNTNLNAGTFPNNCNRNSNAHPHNEHPNNDSYPHNGLQNFRSFPQPAPHNPNILIQTGHGEPGSQTVLINLSPHIDPRNATSHPHTVQVSLQPQGQPNQNVTSHNGQQNNTSPQQLVSQQNQPQTGEPNSDAQARSGNTQSALNSTLGNRDQDPMGLIPTGYSQPTEQPYTSRRTRATNRSSEPHQRNSNDTRSRSSDTSNTSTHPRQNPWDLLRGTPAYPNPEVDSSDSSDYPTSQAQRGRSSQVPRQSSPVVGRRNVQREAPSSSRSDLNLQRQDLQRRGEGHQNQSALPLIQTHGAHNAGVSPRPNVPQNQATQGQTAMQHASPGALIQTRVPQNAGVSQRPSVPQNQATQRQPAQQAMNQTSVIPPNSVPLTQAALQFHTSNTTNPFANQPQQTPATLQHSGPQTRPSQTSPPKTKPSAQPKVMPPTPPPVLRPAEFHMLPRESLQQRRALQPVQGARRPHGARPHGPIRVMHVSPQRHQPMHAILPRHGPVPAHGHGPVPAHGHGPVPAHGHGPVPAHGHGPVPAHRHGPVPAHRHGPVPAHGPSPNQVHRSRTRI